MTFALFQEEKNDEKNPVSGAIVDDKSGFWIPVLYTHCKTSAWMATSVNIHRFER